jgi:hypothetical protein
VANGGTGAISLAGVLKGNGASAFTAMTGTQDYLTKWTDTNTLGTSTIFDNGTDVAIGTTTLGYKLNVAGTIHSSVGGYIFPDGTTQLTAAGAGGNAAAYGATSTAPNNSVYVDSNGYVGINASTSLAASLTIVGTSTVDLLNITPYGTTTPAFYIMSSDGINPRVGIGTNVPSDTFDVIGGVTIQGNLTMAGAGFANITGVNKLTVNTIDPLYNINGTKYSTYAPSISGGVKEETVGVIKLAIGNPLPPLQGGTEGGLCSVQNNKDYSYVIDFNNLAEGSNLWLFHKVTDFGKDWDNLVIALTPNFNGNAWYEKDVANNKLIIHGKPDGSASEVSYRLIANRYDSEKWPNLAPDQNEKTSLIIK